MSQSESKSDEVRGGARGWRIAFLVLCTVGACLAADLVRLHVKVHTDPDYHSYCAMSERVNCDTVALSKYAVVFGLPVAVWGLLGYALMGALAAWGLRSRLRTPSWPFGALFWLSVVSTASGVALFVVSHFVIHSVCIVCASTWLVSISLLVVALLELRRAGSGPLKGLRAELSSVRAWPVQPLLLAGSLGVVLVALWLLLPTYWRIDMPWGPGQHAFGETAQGRPWIGARAPKLVITEFSDYECPHCQRGHEEMRQLVDAHPAEVRLVHCSFPLDQACNPLVRQPFHRRACQYARLAHCAAEQGRFWEANDYLFANGRREDAVSSAELAGAVGLDGEQLARCVASQEAAAAVRDNLMAGQELRIRGTPTFVIGDQTFPGRVPPDVLTTMLDAGERATPRDAAATRLACRMRVRAPAHGLHRNMKCMPGDRLSAQALACSAWGRSLEVSTE